MKPKENDPIALLRVFCKLHPPYSVHPLVRQITGLQVKEARAAGHTDFGEW